VRSAAVMSAARGPRSPCRGVLGDQGLSSVFYSSVAPIHQPGAQSRAAVVAGAAVADGESMLWEIAMRADWRLIAVALAIGVFVVATVVIWNRSRIWKRIRTIETQLSKMQNEITAVLQVQVALITRLNVTSNVETDPRSTAVETGGGDVAGQTTSPPAASAQSESAKSAKLPK
jgi:hypothetical protein